MAEHQKRRPGHPPVLSRGPPAMRRLFLLAAPRRRPGRPRRDPHRRRLRRRRRRRPRRRPRGGRALAAHWAAACRPGSARPPRSPPLGAHATAARAPDQPRRQPQPRHVRRPARHRSSPTAPASGSTPAAPTSPAPRSPRPTSITAPDPDRQILARPRRRRRGRLARRRRPRSTRPSPPSPDDALAHALLAAALRNAGDPAAALAEAERARALDPDLPEALFETGAALAETGETARAADGLARADRRSPRQRPRRRWPAPTCSASTEPRHRPGPGIAPPPGPRPPPAAAPPAAAPARPELPIA